ncbi:unnamed protein product [Agarophyton chilense]|eukprot:gb/GEZJ01007296.1/.p2 GENE.gb/GEZJ01007296.1/~~gb/GEZJ01007296.1/.p2  ORF type:complete len:220 (-),score=26.78 gb/GEZJ01007296.1/:19-678(-)
MRLRELEAALQRVAPFTRSSVRLEQYATPAHIAARMVHVADVTFDDVRDKMICDLGCGAGVLSLGALLRGAAHVVALDVDAHALVDAARNSASTRRLVDMAASAAPDLLAADALARAPALRAATFDAVLCNPPFGTRRRGVDMAFVREALRLITPHGAVYSLHKSSTRAYVRRALRRMHAVGTLLAELRFELRATHAFHTRRCVLVHVDLWRCTTPRAQ